MAAVKWCLPHLLRRPLASKATVRAASECKVGEDLRVSGWVLTMRKHKEFTFLSLSDGSSAHPLHLVAPTASLPHARDLNIGCSVTADGVMVESSAGDYRLEMQVANLSILGVCDPMEYPFKQRVKHTREYTRQFPHLRARTRFFSSVLRVRHTATIALHQFFALKGFINCHTPILSSSDCEGAGELFQVKQTDTVEEFFGGKTFLTVSGQLHAEALMSGLTSVYTFGPTFRAEKSHTMKHLSEFYMVEAETVTSPDSSVGLTSLMKLIEELITSTAGTVWEENDSDLALINDILKPKIPPLMNPNISTPFQTMTYCKAIEVLSGSDKDFHIQPKWGCDLSGEHEQHLLAHCGQEPLFVTHFPATLKPFYAKQNDTSAPGEGGSTVASFDLLVPGVGELVGGTIREDRYDVLKDRLKREKRLSQYEWYLDLRRFGSIPHGGFGLGFERLLQGMLGLDNIKDTIPFPRYAGSCQL